MLSLTNRRADIILALRSLWATGAADFQAVAAFPLRRIPTSLLPRRLLIWFGSSPLLR